MAYSEPVDRATGLVVTSAIWNQDIAENQRSLFPDEDASVAYTTSLRGETGGSPGSSVVGGRQWRVGPLQFVWVRWVVGSAAGIGVFYMVLPAAYSGIVTRTAIGSWRAQDATTSANNKSGVVFTSSDGSDDTARFALPEGNVVTGTDPFAWDADDVLTMYAVYPTA